MGGVTMRSTPGAVKCLPLESGEWASREEWNKANPAYERLFPFIDKDSNGRITLPEHSANQEDKKQHPDWQKKLKAELGKE